MELQELENIVRRQLRPTPRQWREVQLIASELGVPCNGRGCCNYKLDIATQCALKLRKKEMTNTKKREPEYRLQMRWRERGFVLSGSREIINGRTFTQEHAKQIVKRGLAWKFLEVVEEWNRSDVKEELAKARAASEATTEVEVSENIAIDGDGTSNTETVVKKSRKSKKSEVTATDEG